MRLKNIMSENNDRRTPSIGQMMKSSPFADAYFNSERLATAARYTVPVIGQRSLETTLEQIKIYEKKISELGSGKLQESQRILYRSAEINIRIAKSETEAKLSIGDYVKTLLEGGLNIKL
jgi:hypothetical protein